MATTILSVPTISCEHCERTITGALTPVPGVRGVAVDIPARTVRVDYDDTMVDTARMQDILQEEDYPVASASAA